MHITNVEEYLSVHEKRQIRNGRSGALVWETEGKYVLKYVQRAALPEPEVYKLYQNEAHFYRLWEQKRNEKILTCLPEVLDVQVSDQEILILMKKYQELSGEEAGEELLERIMGALAVIHTQEIPAFLRREQKQPEYLGEDQIESCLAGWRSVLAEHEGMFDEGILTKAAADINEVIGWHHEEEQVLNHGDFHWDNLLQKENGDIVVCDWQGVNAGGASGDISFFLSRLGANGITMDREKAAESYCRKRFQLTGQSISREDLLRHMDAANMMTSFQFWHQYLHGSDCDRVRRIYEKMKISL
ncbi:MAG: aminoglycoside phosphotransferase family protein [Acetatifactor sp.]|nr:aminoglycoside phosphotransferase family protein [Acetatifactor sp.]